MRKRILLCDDDEAISEMIKIMLENEDFQVRLLPNGKAIKKQVKEYSPDLILIDIWMPGIDGKEVVKLLKKDQMSQHIPIIIISALHENQIKQIVKKIGADGYLPKPFDIKDLLATVKRYIGTQVPASA